MEYSTISMLDYFEDTQANVGLPEAWRNVTRMMWLKLETKFKHESNQIKKTESNSVENHEFNPVKQGESNQVKHGDQSGTADADDGPSVR